MQPNGSWYPVAGNAYLHTGGVLNRRSGGEGTSLRCTLYFSYFRTSFSFSLWLGEWDHFTRRTETFRKISNMYGYFLYILHCMDFSVNFRWWGEGGMVTAAGPSCGPSAQGVKPPSVLRPGCCCYMQEIAPVDYWQQAHSSSLGGPRHFGTGPGLTKVIFANHPNKLISNSDISFRTKWTLWLSRTGLWKTKPSVLKKLWGRALMNRLGYVSLRQL